MIDYSFNNELYHHGIKGQKWGVRRYQNPDGSLTNAGVKRYGKNSKKYGMVYDYKHQRAYNKMKKGVEKGELSKKQMNRGLKELGMSNAEINFRDATRDYTNLTRKARGVGWFVAGPIGGLAAEVAVMNTTSVGREYSRRFDETSMKYVQERTEYREKHGY